MPTPLPTVIPEVTPTIEPADDAPEQPVMSDFYTEIRVVALPTDGDLLTVTLDDVNTLTFDFLQTQRQSPYLPIQIIGLDKDEVAEEITAALNDQLDYEGGTYEDRFLASHIPNDELLLTWAHAYSITITASNPDSIAVRYY
jgi:hypothetical protein